MLPLNANVLALTPLNPFRPRRWHGALLAKSATTTIEVLFAEKRPVTLAADHDEVRDVASVTIELDPRRAVWVGFDPDHHLDERLLAESFAS